MAVCDSENMGVKALASAVLAALAVLGTAAPASATFPGRNGTIAYTGRPELHAQERIDLVAPDGSDRLALTQPPPTARYPVDSSDFLPAWSPDSTRIAFVAQRPNGSGGSMNSTRILDVATGAQRELCACTSPAWTPDGRMLVSESRDNVFGIYSYALDGTDPRLVVAAPPGLNIQEPAISADGKHIAYVTVSDEYPLPMTLWVADADGGSPHRIARGRSPSFSPDSTRLVYFAMDPADTKGLPAGMMVSDLHGLTRTRVITAPDLTQDSATWSPDGSELAVVVYADFLRATLVAVKAPVGSLAQPPGPDSPGCLRGYRIILEGYVASPDWGSGSPLPGVAGRPADVPCAQAPAPAAPAPDSTSEATPNLRAAIALRSRELRVRVHLAAGAEGGVVVSAKRHGRALARRGRVGTGTLRTYRFRAPRTGTAMVRVSFTGRSGWASQKLAVRRVRLAR